MSKSFQAALATVAPAALSTAALSALSTESVAALDSASLKPLDAATAAFAETGSAQPGEILGGGLGPDVQTISGDGTGTALPPIDEAEAHRSALEASATARAADAVDYAEASGATHVEARVLAECEFGKPNDLAQIPLGRVEELEKAFVIDTHPEAVRFAKRVASGEISA